jgi:rare lipoprotein A
MRYLMTSAVLSLAVSAGAALPASAGDTLRASSARERSDASRTHHERRAVRRGRQHLTYTGPWETFFGFEPRPHRSHATRHARRTARYGKHRHAHALHDRRRHRLARHATTGRRAALHAPTGRRPSPSKAPSLSRAPSPSKAPSVSKAPSPTKKNVGTAHGQQGIASFYSEPQRVASGGWFNPNAMTAAHRSLPFGTRVRVTHRGSGRSVDVTINDRGPYVAGRIIDLSRAAAGLIGLTAQGLARVTVEVLGR